MSFTYTYTARSTEDSSKAVTFTIIDDKLKIDLTGLYDQVSKMSKEEERKDVLKDILSTQSKFVILKTMEKLSEPIHLTDIKPSYDDEDFTLTFWKRVGGLRLAPIVILMGEVDNPEAAQAFIATLEERKSQIGKASIFSGPLDYWFTWAALAISALILIRWPHKKESQK